MTAKQYSSTVLTRNDVLWLCKPCNNIRENCKSRGEYFITNQQTHELKTQVDAKITKIQQNMENLSTELRESITKLENTMKDTITNSTQNYTQKMEETLQRSYTNALTGKGTSDGDGAEKIPSVIESMKDVMAQERREQTRLLNEKEEKQKNFILYRAHEEEGASFEERKSKDKQIVETVLETIDRNDVTVKACFRIGRFNSENVDPSKSSSTTIPIGTA